MKIYLLCPNFVKGHTCSLSCPVVLTHHPTCGNAISPHQLRICKRCGEIDKELATISQGISDVNTKGIIGGFTSECLPWVPSWYDILFQDRLKQVSVNDIVFIQGILANVPVTWHVPMLHQEPRWFGRKIPIWADSVPWLCGWGKRASVHRYECHVFSNAYQKYLGTQYRFKPNYTLTWIWAHSICGKVLSALLARGLAFMSNVASKTMVKGWYIYIYIDIYI